jgi:glycosyltransferase involved in cell wall biosynthesis
MSITFLIPSYNSTKSIEETVKEISNAVLEKKNIEYEILIVDDCSPDDSFGLIKKLSEKYQGIRFYQNSQNLGFCKNFLKGIDLSTKEFLMFIPSGNVINSLQIIKIINAIDKNDMVIVNYSNQLESREISRVIISKLFTWAINIFFINKIKYFNGTNVYKTELLRKIKIFSNSFIFQSELILKMIMLTNQYRSCSVTLKNIKKKNTSFFIIANIKKNFIDFIKLVIRKII